MFWQQFVNWINLGAMYALLAIGYTMVYGIIRLINFAHGEIFMYGAFFTWWLMTALSIPFPLAAVIAVVLSSLLGVGVERIAYRPLRNAPRYASSMYRDAFAFAVLILVRVFRPQGLLGEGRSDETVKAR